MLRTRLATAALALPALWLIIEYLPDRLFAGFIGAVAAVGLHEYFTMAFREAPLERGAGIACGLGVTAGVISRRPELWGAGIAESAYSVSPQRRANTIGPKPIENRCTSTPRRLATMKCPSSCTKTSTPSATPNASNVNTGEGTCIRRPQPRWNAA